MKALLIAGVVIYLIFCIVAVLIWIYHEDLSEVEESDDEW